MKELSRKRGAERLRKMAAPAGLDYDMARAPRPAFYGRRPARGEHDVVMLCHMMHKGGMEGGGAGGRGLRQMRPAGSGLVRMPAGRCLAAGMLGAQARERTAQYRQAAPRFRQRGRPLKMHLSS